MTKYKNEGDMYLEMYPRFDKWMNQCIACGRKGYKPEYLLHSPHPNILEYFSELEVNSLGFCEQCSRHIK